MWFGAYTINRTKQSGGSLVASRFIPDHHQRIARRVILPISQLKRLLCFAMYPHERGFDVVQMHLECCDTHI